MRNRSEFDQRVGKVSIPTAEPISSAYEIQRPLIEAQDLKAKLFKYCSITPKQGCYRLTFRPSSGFRPTLIATKYKGTMRFEEVDDELVVSGDLYKFNTIYPLKYYKIAKKYERRWGNLTIGKEVQEINYKIPRHNAPEVGPFKLPPRKSIPIYARKKYFSYLQGVSANLSTFGFVGRPCNLSITFDEFFYNHPATGFDGSFPAVADRTVRMQFKDTDKDDYFEGSLYQGDTKLGSFTLDWVSSFFRRAELNVHQLEGAVMPQAVPASSGVGTEDFSTIFASAGWSLSVTREDDEVALPASLDGVQDPNSCWTKPNSHDLMDSLPGFDSSVLDSRWKVYLIAVPATLGCSRGRMFDNTDGDVNDIAREGSLTHSHDGYPSGDTAEYGDAEDDLQKDHPRAFLRSAAHEVGHSFNQIHQFFAGEGGSGNSIMTVTPAVSIALDDAGETFPDDIDLAFNATVRRHLIHQPDPAVRPGAMSFFGNNVTAPEADVNFFDADDLELDIKIKSRVKLGEPVNANWVLTNKSDEGIPIPDHIDANGPVAHISVTSPSGSIRYMQAAMTAACSSHHISQLEKGKSRKADTTLFWSKNGFAFESPGRHNVEVILLWNVDGLPLGVRSNVDVWVDYPLTDDDNEVAALMLTEDVGRLVAFGSGRRHKLGSKRIAEVLEKYAKHPACEVLGKIIKGTNEKKGYRQNLR